MSLGSSQNDPSTPTLRTNPWEPFTYEVSSADYGTLSVAATSTLKVPNASPPRKTTSHCQTLSRTSQTLCNIKLCDWSTAIESYSTRQHCFLLAPPSQLNLFDHELVSFIEFSIFVRLSMRCHMPISKRYLRAGPPMLVTTASILVFPLETGKNQLDKAGCVSFNRIPWLGVSFAHECWLLLRMLGPVARTELFRQETVMPILSVNILLNIPLAFACR